MSSAAPAARPAWSWIEAYYLATPLFALADWLGANVRAVGLAGHPEIRAGYYVICTCAGALVHLRPSWSAGVGLLESSANVLLLVLAVVLPYYDAVASVAAGGGASPLPMTPGFLVNFLISGAVWTSVFHRSVRRLEGRNP
jgi:hypothetical protein